MTTKNKGAENGAASKDNDITGSADPVSHTLANAAGELSTLAERCLEASKRIRGLTGHDRYVIMRDLSQHLRNTGGGLHDYARGLEDFLRGS